VSRRRIVLALVFCGILISYVDRGNLGIAAPFMMSEFRLTPQAMGVLLSAFFWTYAVFQIPAGLLLDRFGIRWTYALAFLVWSLSSAAIAFSRGFSDVLSLRMLLGLAESVGPLASLVFIRQNFTGPERGLPVSIYIAGQTLGPACGTLLGTILLSRFGWRFMFAVTGLGALLWVPAWAYFARAKPAVKPIREESVERAAGGQWGEIFRQPVFYALAGCVFFISYYWYFVLTWVPTYLIVSRGMSTLGMGRLLSIPLFLMALVNVAMGGLADRLISRKASLFRVRCWFLAAGLLGSSSILILIVLPNTTTALPVLITSICSFGVASASLWTIAQQVAPAAAVGRTIGVLNTVAQVAGAAAPVITGWSLGPHKNFGFAILLAGVSPLLALPFLMVANPRALERLQRSDAGVGNET